MPAWLRQKPIVILGVFVADTAYRAARQPRMGETILGIGFQARAGRQGLEPGGRRRPARRRRHLRHPARPRPFRRHGQADVEGRRRESRRHRNAGSYTGAAYIFVEETTGNNAIIVCPGAAIADLAGRHRCQCRADRVGRRFRDPTRTADRRGFAGAGDRRAAGVTTILNPAPAAKLPDRIYKLCDYLTPNETETEELTGIKVASVDDASRAAERLLEMGVGTAIITLGEKGALLHSRQQSEHVAAFRAGDVVETTGAGDAFNGGFAAGLSRGLSPLEAVRFACAVAGISVTRPGTAPSMPTLARGGDAARRRMTFRPAIALDKSHAAVRGAALN